ncbi:nurim isoform X1 [Heterocephalus glaber]|uniref:Nurim n=1 Tax=Heterocephalus glaber TaxID=10181 RepID=A0AAX6T4J1_HETGA|nr:nurim isoform X1 [Heterocephalus glaber]
MAPALLLVPAGLACFVLAFGTGVEFVRFASLRPLLGGAPPAGGPGPRQGWLAALQDRTVLASLAWDLGLLLLFVGQHSLMATEAVKAWTSRHFGVLQRSVYVACTALALQTTSLGVGRAPRRHRPSCRSRSSSPPARASRGLCAVGCRGPASRVGCRDAGPSLPQLVMQNWEAVPSAPALWEARTEPWATWVPLLCFVLHIISWLLIFSILLVFDYAELMGLKQVYYHVLGLGEPLALKSPRALRLFSHLRHPVCVELLTVLWVVPTLGADRLLLALFLTLYLGLAHGLDQQDLRYLRAQLQRKLHLLSRPQDEAAE